MDAKEALLDYFHNTVKPTVDEFIQSPMDVRRARLAAIVLEHMSDYVNLANGVSGKEKVKHAREQLFEACPDARHIRDAANASKHAKLTGHGKDDDILKRMSSTADQIQAEDLPGLWDAPSWEEGNWAEASYVKIKLDQEINGEDSVCLEIACKHVLAYWEDYIPKITKPA